MLIAPREKVIIEPMYDPEKIGSIYIPETAKGRSKQGIVKYIGEDCKLVKVGDHVLFGAYAGSTIQLEGEGVLIILFEIDVLAVIEDVGMEVPGLYFRSRDGEYFPANYEMALSLIVKAVDESTLVQTGDFNP